MPKIDILNTTLRTQIVVRGTPNMLGISRPPIDGIHGNSMSKSFVKSKHPASDTTTSGAISSGSPVGNAHPEPGGVDVGVGEGVGVKITIEVGVPVKIEGESEMKKLPLIVHPVNG